jgi:alpha-amylase/alpha-mannosidase (GH57 family)
MTQVAILWHMHQPYYEDLLTHEHILPWVRLHGLKDYYGMVALLREFPRIRMTFNLVPSLLVQIETFAANQAHDRFLELSLKPAVDLTNGDVGFILENFFHAHRQRMIDVYPRYSELLARRGSARPADIGAAARRFSRDDLCDLQVWHKLAWFDPLYLEGDARIRALVGKGRGFTEEDKQLLHQVELELLGRIIPEYRAAAERGQVELSTSPFYHPILPLLCDTDIYLRTHPESRMPRRRFAHPEDAAEQLTRARALHERLFGRPPVGLWPSEGSVSDAMVPLAAAAGFTWMATDELILGRTLGVTFGRDGQGHVHHPERLYTPYEIRAGGGSIACVFRDHVLSDLIGFTYAGWAADAAAADLVSRLVEAGRRYSARTQGQEALITVILDGENAWEHFEGGGRPFLRALYGRLSREAELRTVTISEACERTTHQMTGIFPGSWIDANFYIWIGHQDDQRAWSQLADARDAVEAAQNVGAADRARARESVLAAEGSDWFWWYGDDHSSAHDLEFDDLFRRTLRNAYQLIGRPTPDELFVSNITAGVAAPAVTRPSALLKPAIDGEETSYFEWLGAGVIEIREVAGAMHRADARRDGLKLVHFGFDDRTFYVRFDADRAARDLLADGFEFSIRFLRPADLRFSIRQTTEGVFGMLWTREGAESAWTVRGTSGGRVAASTVIEAALPLDALGRTAGDPLSFFVTVHDSTGREVERHPALRPVDVTVPDERFDARNWTA